MDELKIVADTLAQLGGEARYAFVAWLVAKYGASLLQAIVMIGGFAWVITTVVKSIQKHVRATRVAEALCRATKINSGYWNSESDRCFATLIKWIELNAKP